MLLFYFPHGLAHEATDTATATAESGYMTDRTYIADPSLYDRFTQAAPDWLVGGVPIAIAVMLLCRMLAECLIVVSRKTATKADDQLAAALSKISWVIAKGLSWIGVGIPKAILESKITSLEQPEVKKDANGTTDSTLKDDIRIS